MATEKRQKRLRLWMLPVFIMVIGLITLITGRALRDSEAASGGDYSVTFFILLYINLFLVIALGFLVVRNASRLWLERRKRLAGSQLRTRVALLFVGLSLLPAVLIALLSAGLLNRGVDSWFSERVGYSLEQSLQLARSYYEEHQRTVRHDAEEIASTRELLAAISLGGETAISPLGQQLQRRKLDEIALLRADGTYIAKVGDLPFDPLPDLTPLANGQLTSLLSTNDTGSCVRAFVRVADDLYLSVGRWIDRQVLAQMETIEKTYVDYNQLRAARGVLKTTHTVTLILISLLLLLAAVWSGFRIADQLTDPITHLVIGTRQVASGDFSVTMPVSGEDELATLMASFNAMTHRLAVQRDQLQASNSLLEERRRFMEAIVHNISAGVIRIDRLEVITLLNAAAALHLGVTESNVVGKNYKEVLTPEWITPLTDALQRARHRGSNDITTTQIQLQGPSKPLTLIARVTFLADTQGQDYGFVITFDDISEILSAQRAHAWSDVARRIAHEIKNPLTPIQLSAQRMRRKYLQPKDKNLPPDWQVMDECTNTIIRQVEELRVLVNEFSNFARLPRPDLDHDDLNAAIQELLVLFKEETKLIKVRTQLSERLPRFPFDRAQIKQVATNLIANALAAIQEHHPQHEGELAIVTSLQENGQMVSLQVIDNGPGIPVAVRDRIFEPYFTTKHKGTGLGLAIVKKIVEDHRGIVRIRDPEKEGALVEVLLPIRPIQIKDG